MQTLSGQMPDTPYTAAETGRTAPEPQSRDQENARDEARVDIATPLSPARLRQLVKAVEPLLRVNPLYEIEHFEKTAPDAGRLRLRNLATEQEHDLTFHIRQMPDGLRLTWQGWLKTATEMRILPPGEESPAGTLSRLVLIDDYSGVPEEERSRRTDEVDTTLLPWAHALYRHFRHRRWLERLPGGRAFLDSFWLRMKPSGRRISFILIVLGLFELAFFAFIVLIFWLEWQA